MLVGHRRIIAKTEKICRSGPARILPLGFGWQTVGITGGQSPRLRFAACDRRTILQRLVVADLFNRALWITLKATGIFSGDGVILSLRHLMRAEPEIARQRHELPLANKAAGLDQYHIG